MSGTFSVNYNAGGTVDEVKRIGYITGFPQFTQPYNRMKKVDIPAVKGDYDISYESPDEETELLAITMTATGYNQLDKYEMYCNDELWFDNWYLGEVKEGLFLGQSTYVYRLPPKSKFKIIFHNNSGNAKALFIGFRMLKNDEGGK